jgi:hypothetical protein
MYAVKRSVLRIWSKLKALWNIPQLEDSPLFLFLLLSVCNIRNCLLQPEELPSCGETAATSLARMLGRDIEYPGDPSYCTVGRGGTPDKKVIECWMSENVSSANVSEALR